MTDSQANPGPSNCFPRRLGHGRHQPSPSLPPLKPPSIPSSLSCLVFLWSCSTGQACTTLFLYRPLLCSSTDLAPCQERNVLGNTQTIQPRRREISPPVPAASSQKLLSTDTRIWIDLACAPLATVCLLRPCRTYDTPPSLGFLSEIAFHPSRYGEEAQATASGCREKRACRQETHA